MIELKSFTPEMRGSWDRFVRGSKNGVFFFERDFMEYHAHRFVDASVIVFDDGVPIALLPANRVGSEMVSHGGLAFGGLVTDERMNAALFIRVLRATLEFLDARGVETITYKLVPGIYHRLPAEEDRFGLFLARSERVRCEALSVVRPGMAEPIQERRRRGAKRAAGSGVRIEESGDWVAFWSVLTSRLRERYDVAPVHTFDEISLLRDRFPKRVRLITAVGDGEVLAGVVVFETDAVARLQYIAAGRRGRELGALDLLVCELLTNIFREKPYVDFVSSHKQGTLELQEGLVEYKAGFGGGCVVQEHYRIDIRAARQALEKY